MANVPLSTMFTTAQANNSAIAPAWSLALFGSDSARKFEVRRASRGRVTFEKETRRKPLAGRDAYGGSNVFWYCSSPKQASVYAEVRVERVRMKQESFA